MLTHTLTSRLIDICGPENVITALDALDTYSRDQTEDLSYLPEVVCKPDSTEQIQAIARLSDELECPITVRGAGSGLAGGALPIASGIVLSMERMNRILYIDRDNYQVRVEPGVITEELQNALAEQDLFYPVDPASRGWSYIGGNVATGAGGPRAVKYGTVRDYVLNIKAVLPNGDLIETGANTLKNSTGYDLTRLLVGSEGTLAIITEITLKLLPLPTHRLLLLMPFESAEQACACVAAIFQAGVTPSALEFMERAAIDRAANYVGGTSLSLPDEIQAHLLVEVDGRDPEQLYRECEAIAEVGERYGCTDALFADSAEQQRELWHLRRNVGNATKVGTIYKEEDTVVPRAHLPELLRKVKKVGAAFGFESVCYGHAGDGNLHVNILRGDLTDTQWHDELPEAIREIFTFVRSLGGTISGEHGIGYVQRRYMDIAFGEAELCLMQGIKAAFDPKGLLNPGKIWLTPEYP